MRIAFNYKILRLKKGETGTIGFISGLLVIVHGWSGAESSVTYVDSYHKAYTHVAGKKIQDIPLNITWEGTEYNTQMKITSTYRGTSGATDFNIAYQSIGDKI